ncbi:putative acyl-activating enzyme 19 isoform X2 [Rutidosis leptorrhynchoides]|uniref:putative acyl-activating enzyme 19 isoform X2 n=1 Tax=Rutidosis leptorrhynchoides TaxID=125765 RepID=UPI003A999ECD
MKQKNLCSLSSCCISHEFHKSATKNPNKIAVIHSSLRHRDSNTTRSATSPSLQHPPVYADDVSFTYSELLEAVDSLSSHLRFIIDGGVDPAVILPSLGLRPIDQSANTPRIVGIYMVPSVEYIISVLSVMRCGEAFLPLDPSWPKDRVLSVVSSSTASLILCGSNLLNGSHQIHDFNWLADSACCPVLVVSMKTILNKYFASHSLPQSCAVRPFSYLMYTSGSTGKPKSVCGTEQGLLNRFLWMQDMYPLHGEETLLFKTSVGFIDHLQEILGALLTSCTLVIPSFRVLKENILSISEYLQDYSINRLVAVPSLMRMLLPTFQSSNITSIQRSLKLLVLSGEILHISLWNSLTKLLPDTSILNLYGSTEVSGDCTYFDCKRLTSILKTESLSTVPIGIPIPNCEVVLVGEDAPNNGELYVSGSCTAIGYFNHEITHLKSVNMLPEYSFCCSDDEKERRNDRTVKVNGNRIALEEIENTIREHEYVGDAAVILNNDEGEISYLEAYIVTKIGYDSVKSVSWSLRGWLVDKLPLAMISSRFFFVDSLPLSSSGKVDYKLLASLRCTMSEISSENEKVPDSHLLQTIKEAFCDALGTKEIADTDDFFVIGGDSVSAAHTCYKLGINMKMLYTFSTPLKLAMSLLNHKLGDDTILDMEVLATGPQVLAEHKDTDLKSNKPRGRLSSKLGDDEYHPHKVYKLDGDLNVDNTSFAISRCNKVMFGEKHIMSRSFQATWFLEEKASIRELWKVHMESCVDASPLVVARENDIFVYIGSHSHKFICIKASSGFVQWEVQLEGRVECSAAILGDFSEVVVGCYKGNIYFLNSLNGIISWTYQTGDEVKAQPLVDKQRHLVWCGSYDHNLYALDYRRYCCVYKLNCDGSIYGSPVINEDDERLYFASTNGSMTALSLKEVPFSVLWLQDMGSPIFGSLSIDHVRGNVICCLVNGHIVAVDANGSILWRGITGGPIFAGPCVSHVLKNQVVICSRDGSVYSFGLENGYLLWKHDLGDPISSSAYIDENLQFISDNSVTSDRLICVCTSSGVIVLLRINLECVEEKYVVRELCRLDIKGAIFSSPVMIGGRIFVGCRDDYVHRLGIKNEI